VARLTRDDERSIAILHVALDEQRRFHDELTRSFDVIKSKIVYYIGAILATMTFLYSGALDEHKSTLEKLFIPNELYGMLFYFFGVICLLYSLAVLAKGMRPDIRWNVYTEATEQRVVGGVDTSLSEREYLQDMVDGYESYTNTNLESHNKKSEATRAAFFPMVMGAIILTVLRLFQ
jgi:hypothetical protein